MQSSGLQLRAGRNGALKGWRDVFVNLKNETGVVMCVGKMGELGRLNGKEILQGNDNNNNNNNTFLTTNYLFYASPPN